MVEKSRARFTAETARAEGLTSSARNRVRARIWPFGNGAPERLAVARWPWRDGDLRNRETRLLDSAAPMPSTNNRFSTVVQQNR